MTDSIFSNVGIKEQFDQKGYVVIPFAGEILLKQLRCLFDSIEHLPSKGTHVTMFNPSSEYRRFVDLGIKHLTAERAEKIMDGYKVLYTNFMVKEPGLEGDFPVHQDWTYVDETRFRSYAFWIPLQDVDETNGTLHMAKGSHRFQTALRGPYVHEPFRNVSQKIKKDFSEAVRLNAGEALIWDHRVIHFSEPNLTDKPRVALTLIMVPKESEVIHCYGTPESRGTIINKMRVDTDFFMKYTIGSKPDFVPLLEIVEQPAVNFDEAVIKKLTGFKQNE